MAELRAIRAFHAAVAERQSERTERFAHGTAFFVDRLPDVYDLNYLQVEDETSAEELLVAADELQAGLHHRKAVVPDEDLGARLVPGLEAAGWTAVRHVHMAHRRRPDRKADVAQVRELELEDLAPAHRTTTLRSDWGDESTAEQLFEAKRLRASAVRTRHFGVVEGDRVVAYCDLYEHGGVAQIEDVNTLVEARGEGYGRAVVARALEEARSSGLIFLDALADDWPRRLYARMGFDVVGRTSLFVRYPGPLPALQLRTDRLELRLPTDAEVLELAHAIEEHGVHPREEMPFRVPWTDAMGTPAFVPDVLRHFREQRAARRPDDWAMNFVAFLDGRPVGSQSIAAESFAVSRSVTTGSYLLRPLQGQGLGTEMRAAVLTLAFDVLGAERAESGAVVGNEASARVSAKLGYEQVGWNEVSPRGEPVQERQLEVTRERWHAQPHPRVELLGPLQRVRTALGAR